MGDVDRHKKNEQHNEGRKVRKTGRNAEKDSQLSDVSDASWHLSCARGESAIQTAPNVSCFQIFPPLAHRCLCIRTATVYRLIYDIWCGKTQINTHLRETNVACESIDIFDPAEHAV